MKKKRILTIMYVLVFTLTASYLSLAHGWKMFAQLDPSASIENPVPVAPVTAAAPVPMVEGSKSAIQVALLLDVSGSMSGLIEQAKSQLWKILNELSVLEKEDGEPDLEIGLYVYGSSGIGNEKNEILKLVDFTTDMDLVSQKLFELGTSGSDEYAGEVIGRSLKELEWRTGTGHLKTIYIAGNESFNQGRVPYATACGQAVESGIVVNTIFCGDRNEGIKLEWQRGAVAGNGYYFHIDHNQQTTYIETPYDDQINTLNNSLNDTYIPFGEQGVHRKLQQKQQDTNAASYSKANSAERAKFKSSKKYKAESWDLVDAYKKDKMVVKEKEALPAEFKALSTEEINAKIEIIIADRIRIKEEIQAQNKLRDAFILNAKKETSADHSLEGSILKSIQDLADKQGFVKTNGQ